MYRVARFTGPNSMEKVHRQDIVGHHTVYEMNSTIKVLHNAKMAHSIQV